jgi:hypothetical protein
MTEEQFIKTILTAVEKNFPKDCTSCGHRFYTYKEYVQETSPLGLPLSYDAEVDNWRPQSPLGFHAYCKCNFCSNTLTTDIKSLENDTIWQLLSWIKEEMKHRGISSRILLNDVRGKMRKQALGE